VLLKSPWLMLAILFGFLGLKLVVIFGLARLMKLPYQERPAFVVLLAQGGEFAFVVFQAAAGVNIVSADTSSLLIGAVALSMLITPLLMIAVDKLIMPLYARHNKPQLEEISEQQDAPIIIAGFGRYGQIIGRMLLAQGVPATILDHDAELIETIRTFGYKVFYGDATRLDLLRTAGAARAKILVLSVDDVEQSLKIVDMVKENFPQLQIVARARDVTHWNALRDRGVTLVERELFESSLRSARSVLELLGQPPHEAWQAAMRFRQHNLALFEKMYPHRKDRSKLIAVATQGRLQLEEQMAQEREQLTQRRPTAWHDDEMKNKLP
jgi:glutathione-regulated potassium-efflux system ancillary protein KefC